MKLVIEGLSFSYGGTKALEGIALQIMGGEVMGLVGPNGAGKSTLLKCIDRILRPQKGVVYLDGKDSARLSSRELAMKMGYVPQNTVEVFPFTVFDVVLMGRRPHIAWSVSKRDMEVVGQTLALMGLDRLAMRHFDELSGGEKQKVSLARALAQEPEVLLLDEPTSNLDIRHQLEVLNIVRDLAWKRHISVVMAIHDLNLASRFSDRLVMLKDNTIFSVGTPSAILSPENIRAVYGVEVRVAEGHVGKPYVIPIAAV